MHIKFLRHGQGSTAGAVRYLLQEHDHNGERRAEVTVLRGDPRLVAQVADSSPHQWRYTSGVIAWAPEDNPSPAEIAQVIEEWESAAFAGLEPDQYATCAVLHRDDDGMPHVHTITARVELTSGRSLNIAPPGHEKVFDPLRDAWNHERGWARPDDPDRARPIQPGYETPTRGQHPWSRLELAAHIEALVDGGWIATADDIRRELAELGEITRTGRDYVSVRPHGMKQTIRLRGALFRDDWSIEWWEQRELERFPGGTAAGAAKRAVAAQSGRVDAAAAQRARERLASAVQRRAEYHRDRYQRRDPASEVGAVRGTGPDRAATDTADLWLGAGAERVGGATAAAGRGHRAETRGCGDPGGAFGPGGRDSELGAVDGDHRRHNAGRGRSDSERPAPDRLADREPQGASGQRKREAQTGAETAPRGRRDPRNQRPDLSGGAPGDPGYPGATSGMILHYVSVDKALSLYYKENKINIFNIMFLGGCFYF